jgi:tRNA pseudouridine55 synthase
MSIVLIDKPKGISSFDVIRVLQRRCREQGVLRKKEGKIKLQPPKMGHSGTLDPRASGLMIIATGKDTKQLATLLGLPKIYTAHIILGKHTASGDLEAPVTEEQSAQHVTTEEVEKVLQNMHGDIELSVPLYSAIKKDGKSLYAYARKGIEVEVPKKIMHIISAHLTTVDRSDEKHPVLEVEFHVKSGTYIRSLAEELGKRLGNIAVLKDLRRTSIGEYRVDTAISAEEVPLEGLLDIPILNS